MLLVPITARASFCIRKLSSFVHFDEEMKASESGPLAALISVNLRATNDNASSHEASRKVSPSRMSGLVRRSWLLMCPQLNFPLMQVETPLAAPSRGSTFRIWRSFVQTSKLQPTPQYVQTVLVFLVRDSRMCDSISETCIMEPYPISGSMPLTTSILPSGADLGRSVM